MTSLVIPSPAIPDTQTAKKIWRKYAWLEQGILSPNKSPKDICKGYRPNGLDEKF